MTIRSSSQALQNQKMRRAQTLCTLFRVVRTDGFVLRFTDHDRPLTVDGEQFLPIGLGAVSAERREAALRSSDQEASGFIDGDTITIPDLLGYRYRGATVYQHVVDWRMPWVWHYRSKKRIRQIAHDGSRWVASLEGVGARLQASSGGRFGGVHSAQCGYRFGDPKTCKANRVIGCVYGPDANGTVTSATSLTVTDSAAAWPVGAYAGWSYQNRGALPGRGEESLIVTNTATTLTLAKPLDHVPQVGDAISIGQGVRVGSVGAQRVEFSIHSGDSTYVTGIDDDYFRDGEAQWMDGDNVGVISPIVGYDSATRTVTLLFPTPFDIAASDHVILRAGCDGLLGTCRDKFSNTNGAGALRHGGTDVFSPAAGAPLEQPDP